MAFSTEIISKNVATSHVFLLVRIPQRTLVRVRREPGGSLPLPERAELPAKIASEGGQTDGTQGEPSGLGHDCKLDGQQRPGLGIFARAEMASGEGRAFVVRHEQPAEVG